VEVALAAVAVVVAGRTAVVAPVAVVEHSDTAVVMVLVAAETVAAVAVHVEE